MKGSHTYSDGTFLNANWRIAYAYEGQGGQAAGEQVKTGGKPDAFREVTDTVYASSSFFAFNGNLKAMFVPSSQGAITSINYSEANRLISGYGEGQRTGPALEQNGQLYFLLDRFYDTPSATWSKVKITGLTAADFSTLVGGTHPDFSQTAAPIEFGFYRANSSGSAYTIAAGIDSWSLTVKTSKTP